MSSINPIESIKEAEEKARIIIEKARTEAQEAQALALTRREKDNESLIAEKTAQAERLYRQEMDKVEADMAEKKQEIRMRTELVIKDAVRQRARTLDLIMGKMR